MNDILTYSAIFVAIVTFLVGIFAVSNASRVSDQKHREIILEEHHDVMTE